MFNDYFAMRSRLWVLLFVLGACTKPNPASCLDDFCDDPALPFCDVDGSIGGIPDTCIAVQCTPQEFQGCRDDHALTCSADGVNIVDVECEFGCGDEGCLPCNTPECQPPETHIIPLYVPTVCNDLATTTFVVTEDTTLDTSDVANCTSVVQQVNGPEICVVHHETIDIADNKTLRFKGTRVIALVADRRLTVDGILDISASATTFSGPGGGQLRSGAQGTAGGGGGAGFRTAGGDGGVANVDGGGANGGAPIATKPAESRILVGGTQAVGTGNGAAGGAATLVCCRCTTSVVGLIDAGGGGGRKGAIGPFGPELATGGGSGGVVALQGLDLMVTGRLFANGGGGGGGGSGAFNDNSNGQDGTRTTLCSLGGGGSGGAGGAGGCLSGPSEGKQGGNNLGGGGGGSAGFFLTYTPQGVTPLLTPAEVSPPLEPNDVIPTN